MINDLSIGSHIRGRMLRDVASGFRTHPLLTLALVIAVSVAVAAAVAAFLVAAVLAAIVLAAVFVAYAAARELLQPGSADAAGRRIELNGGEPAAALRRYLAAVDEFAHLTAVAISIGIEEPPRGKAFRSSTAQAHRLHQHAADLARHWRGSQSIKVCMAELERACAALADYFAELQLRQPKRSSSEMLRWQRDELCRRRDALLVRVRDADFRTAVT